MCAKLITNDKKLLRDVFHNILPSTEELYFLVGYFYFSGFEELDEQLRDKNLKILVGLDIERDLQGTLREIAYFEKRNIARGKIREDFYGSLVSIFNETGYFDSRERQESFRFFLQKVKAGTLQIRKTAEPNHAKMYLLENTAEFSQGGEYPGTLITGSSNLTRAGLGARREINVVFRDQTYLEGKKIFDELWQSAIDIASLDTEESFVEKVVKEIWLDKLPAPFLLYVRVLSEYFSFEKKKKISLPSQITGDKFINLQYQTDAILQSLSILEKHNGVLICDVVGLGKSIIASAVAHNLGLKTIVIAPPHLTAQWEDYRYEFDFNAKIYSSGMIERALEEDDGKDEKVIIIDEAHKYRNEDTLNYGNLHKLCQGKKVILLTATPFNNRPQDIFSLIKLFQIPTKSTIQTVDNLFYQFRQLISEYKKIQKDQKKSASPGSAFQGRIRRLAQKMRGIISPLVIRRSRLDLENIEVYRDDLKEQHISFPKVRDPQLLDYNLGSLSGLYEKTLLKICPPEKKKGFMGARYKPVTYLKNIEKYKKKIAGEFGDETLFRQAQVNLAQFMKRLLVRRFESSIFAFKSTLEAMISSSEFIRDWYEKIARVPICKKGAIPEAEDFRQSTGNELEEGIPELDFEEELREYFESKKLPKDLFWIDKKELKKDFIRDVKKDIQLLREIHQEWFGEGSLEDPKLEFFTDLLKKQLKREPDRKIIVFSEFSDTVNYLYDKLKTKFKIFRYTSKQANKANKRIIRENFDASLSTDRQRDDFDILIATDAISEGFNLHRAGTIFNYDIPYNPTRVIQRVGRINRIQKKVFDELRIYNFFPSPTGEKEARTKAISTLKISLIQALLGEDTRVLTSDEELESFFTNSFKSALSEDEQLSWDVAYLNELSRIKRTVPQIIEEALALPKRVRIRRSEKKEQSGVLVFGKKSGEYAFKLGLSEKECISLGAEEALALFLAKPEEKAEPVSDRFENIYQNVKKNLFEKKIKIPFERSRREASEKLEVLKQKFPERRDYLQDLSFVLSELAGLPECFIRVIRQISGRSLKAGLEKLQREIPHSYLIGIMERARAIEDGEEILILSEELG